MPIGNNSIFGAFTFGEVRSGRLTGDWLHPDAVANYGWFGGGQNPAVNLSTVDRIDFSNDSITASVRGPLSLAKGSHTATGNSNYGWFGGGLNPAITTVDRIDFSNDSGTASVRGPLSSARYSLAATGNSNYGWFTGGGPGPVSRVDRIDFSNDSSTASPRGPLSAGRQSHAVTGNSNYGWFGGALNTSTFPSVGQTLVDRIDFSNDSSTSSPRGPLSIRKTSLAATGNSNYGYFGGGAEASPNSSWVRSTVDRIDFSNDSVTASPRGPLSSARGYMSGSATGNSNYGWFGGGYLPGSSSTVDRIDFSNDSATASVRGPLSLARFGSSTATSGVLNIRRQKAGNFGWFGGGNNTPAGTTTVDRIDFSNDSTTASTRGPLSSLRNRLVATGNSNYGWFGGGFAPGVPASVSTVDRIDFSNDSPTASVRGSLSLVRYVLAATGNSNYGWFGGGLVPGPITYSTVDRIDFSNDSAVASVRGSLSVGRNGLSATGNSNYGWFGGGSPGPLSTVDRINFSNDSTTASSRGPLSLARNGMGATGNSNYGWFGGGATPTFVSTVDRIDFSNDSATASVRGPLTAIRGYFAATGNSNYGWFGGGTTPTLSPTLTATVDRINFANDSVTASVRGPLTLGRNLLAATSNTPIG